MAEQQIVIAITWDLQASQYIMVSRKGSAGIVEFPGGKVEPGETQHQALVREVYEEVGATFSTFFYWVGKVQIEEKVFHLAWVGLDSFPNQPETKIFRVSHPQDLVAEGYKLQDGVMSFFDHYLANYEKRRH